MQNQNNINTYKMINQKIITFPVPHQNFDFKILNKIKTSTISEEEQRIISKAFQFHSAGNLSEAKKYYQLFISKGFKDPNVFSNYGVILRKLGEIDQAIKIYNQSINLFPERPEAYYNIGILLQERGRLKEAEKNTRKAIKINPNYINAYLNLGRILKDMGKIGEAEKFTRKAIRLNPNNVDAYINLGSILKIGGKLKAAKLVTDKAIELNPKSSHALNNLATILAALGRQEEAEKTVRKALELRPIFSEASLNLGNILRDLGRLKEAEISIRKAIKIRPEYLEAYINLGIILKDLGKLKEAEMSTRKAIEINKDFSEAHLNLGIILKDLGKLKEAEMSTRKAIEINKDFSEAHLNLAIILKDFGKFKEAEISTHKAIELRPNYPTNYSNLGIIQKDLGRFTEAEISTRKAIEINPSFADAHYNLGGILLDVGRLEEAEISTRKAIELNHNLINAYSNLGKILKNLGKEEEAKKEELNAIKLDPFNLSYIISKKLYLSEVPFNTDQIELERAKYKEELKIIENNNNFIFKGDLFSTYAFYLAYHNHIDDLSILKKLSKVLSKKEGITNKSFNKINQIKSYKKRNYIRLGICSDFLYRHSVGNFFGNIIKDISNSDIKIIIFRGPNSKEDSYSRSIDSIATSIIRLPSSIKEATNIIINQSIDILFYLDIGMSNYTYLLSLSRLALVQVTTLGHPTTSGVDQIDYFISCKEYETSESDKFYSERLIKLSRIPVNYSIPKIKKSTFKLSNLDIPKNSFLIGIPHSPFKFHPDYDFILDKILESIPNSIFFFADSIKTSQTEALKYRWSKKTKHLNKRTIFHPRVDFDNFLAIVENLDIILDPFYFGMGNTFYHAMAFNIPVVTMPTNHIKSRHAYAGYKQMGIRNAPIADSPENYISICKKLATNKIYIDNIKNEIKLKAKTYLFNDKLIYKEFIAFFKESIDAAQKGLLLQKDWTP